MQAKHVKTTELTDVGLSHVFSLLAGQPSVSAPLGACIYAGKFLVNESTTGTTFYLVAPNARTAKVLREKAYNIYDAFSQVFPLKHLFISTLQDPFHDVPPDYWQYAGHYERLDGTLVGFGIIDNHPHWYAVVKLDDDGRVYR